MIWFACKQCGKTHNRPESSSGSMVFCDCGNGMTVPWESTMEPPANAPQQEEVPSALPVNVPPAFDVPSFQPIPVGEERVPPPPRPQNPSPPPIPYQDPGRQPPPQQQGYPPPHGHPPPERGRRARRPRVAPKDPNYCLNHQKIRFEKVCADCQEKFCNHCVVQFRGAILCGPCKNRRLQKVQDPPKVSGMAIGALIVGLALSPTGLCMLPFGNSGEAIPIMLGAVILQLGALLFGGLALYKTETDAQVGGKSFAITAMLTAGVSAIVTTALAMLSFSTWV